VGSCHILCQIRIGITSDCNFLAGWRATLIAGLQRLIDGSKRIEDIIAGCVNPIGCHIVAPFQ
jgi:hypothetical protein